MGSSFALLHMVQRSGRPLQGQVYPTSSVSEVFANFAKDLIWHSPIHLSWWVCSWTTGNWGILALTATFFFNENP
jgi:inhibitor of KinA sporulation pathway (predicted exonuclease)